MNLNREELAWAAGFFDGEGCVAVYRRNNSRPYIRLRLNQIHPGVLERFHRAVLRIGNIRGPYAQIYGQPQWTCDVHGYERVQAVIAMLWCFLSDIKRTQAKKAILELQPFLGNLINKEKEFCIHGHSLADARIQITEAGGRRRKCRQCDIEYKRSRRALLS